MTLLQRRLGGLLVTTGLGAAAVGVFLWQDRASVRRARDEETRAKILALTEPGSVRELTLTSPAGTFALLREGTAGGEAAWVITTPTRTPADTAAVDGLLQQLRDLKRTASVGGAPDAPAPDKKLFGLEPPRFRLTLVTDKGERETLLAGKKNSFDGSLYVQREGTADVHLVPGALEYQLDKDLLQLRDKRLLGVAKDAVDTLEVRAGGKLRYALARTDGPQYRLTAPRPLPADDVQASELLAALTNAVASRFVSEQASAAELREHGLDRPALQVTVTPRAGSPRTLLLSRRKTGGDERVYAAAAGGGPLLELASGAVLDTLDTHPDALRDKHVLPFDRDAVDRLELRGAGKSLAFVRTRGDAGDSWSLSPPAPAKADTGTLAGLLYRLWNLKAATIVSEGARPADLARYGLDAPSLEVELSTAAGGRLGAIQFGKTEGEDQYVTAAGSGRVDRVSASLAKDLSLDPDAYSGDATARK